MGEVVAVDFKSRPRLVDEQEKLFIEAWDLLNDVIEHCRGLYGSDALATRLGLKLETIKRSER